MKSVRRRHPELAPASPHKLRHTGATLAKQAGVSLEAFSEALTHSDKEITKTYVNIKDKVKAEIKLQKKFILEYDTWVKKLHKNYLSIVTDPTGFNLYSTLS